MSPSQTASFYVVGGLAGLAASYYGIRSWAAGGKASKRDLAKSLSGRNVVITGANTGIGYETALQLAKQGASVYVACRPSQKTDNAVQKLKQQSGNTNIFAEPLDLSSLQTVRDFAQRWEKHGKPIHILINNAGIMALPEKNLTVDGNEAQIGTNHLGHFLFTELLLPYVKKGAEGTSAARIVNLSSVAHTQGFIVPEDLNYEKREYSPWQVYGQSKLANIVYAQYLAKQLKGSNITVNAVHPGVVNTELTRYIDTGILKVLLSVGTILMKTPWEGAQTTLHVALSDECEKVTGEYFHDCKIRKPVPRDGQILDDKLQADFIQHSRRLVGL
ncbi:retinol dehydrogenase 13 [Polychytrium aggregatum]|uniref:retinol dehydrogenase 13 n=1 Tax=Polychytrium aggregatum TaxID=110093 RepID=UPI0022FE596E|nr:retinol dehydrogenase 13 [Polychytrium aggregatum]KAI9199692.1 retinol dehydrogenase 13 [Polychytrium aggregatum]